MRLTKFSSEATIHRSVARSSDATHTGFALPCQSVHINEDLLSPEKVHHWSAAFCARAIADLYARFPRLRVVFCSNRKMAAE